MSTGCEMGRGVILCQANVWVSEHKQDKQELRRETVWEDRKLPSTRLRTALRCSSFLLLNHLTENVKWWYTKNVNLLFK